MTSREVLRHQLAAARITGWRALMIFAGNDCPWCEKLKVALKAGALQRFCQENNIQFSWILLASKKDDLAAVGDKPDRPQTIREELGIKSIPTAILYGTDSKAIASTEFIDLVMTTGESAYIDWVTKFSK